MVTRPSSRAGFTLVELLVVIGIVSALLGLSVVAYQGFRTEHALPAAASRVGSIVRSARNYSVSEGVPSRVLVDVEKQTVTAFGFRTVASWSFESLEYDPVDGAEGTPIPSGTVVPGAPNLRSVLQGLCAVVPGKIGRAVWFGDEGASIAARHRPGFHSPLGFQLEAWVHFEGPELTDRERERAGSRRGEWYDPRREVPYAVISKRDSYEFGVLGDGAVYVLVGKAGDPNGFYAATRGGLVSTWRWVHLSVTLDGVDLTIEIDGIERGWIPVGFEKIDPQDWPFPNAVPFADSDLTVSHPAAMFRGAIDQPTLRIPVDPQSYEMPSGVHLHGVTRKIYFDAQGGLEALHHSAPEEILLADVPPETRRPEAGTGARTRVVEAPGERGSAAGEGEFDESWEVLEEYLDRSDPGRERRKRQLFNEDGAPARTETIQIDLSGAVRG